MQQFINYVCQFVDEIYTAVATFFLNKNQIAYDAYNTWRSKAIFTENSLIGLNITWAELFRFVSVWILSILFIVLFVKFILKIVSVFRV